MLGRKRTKERNEDVRELQTEVRREVGVYEGLSRGVSGLATLSASAKDLIYLASPYSLNGTSSEKVLESRYQMNCRCVFKFMLQGLNIYSPIVYQHSILSVCGYIDKPTNFWLSLDFGILRQSSGMFVLMLEDWDKSVGVEKEIEFARSKNIPITYIHPDIYILTGRNDGHYTKN